MERYGYIHRERKKVAETQLAFGDTCAEVLQSAPAAVCESTSSLAARLCQALCGLRATPMALRGGADSSRTQESLERRPAPPVAGARSPLSPVATGAGVALRLPVTEQRALTCLLVHLLRRAGHLRDCVLSCVSAPPGQGARVG